MSEKGKKIIVGIDPGTTTGICCLDLNGKVLFSKSSKNMGLPNLMKKICEVGEAVVVSCDVKNPPSLVKNVCSKLNACMIHPGKDMSVAEKQNIVRDFFPETKMDVHCSDACASAFYAYSRFRNLFRKIKVHLREKNMENEFERVASNIISGNFHSIQNALEEKTEAFEPKSVKRKKVPMSQKMEADAKREVLRLKSRVYKLEEENKNLLKKIAEQKTPIILSSKKLIETKESNIKNLTKKLKILERKISSLKREISSKEFATELVKKNNLIVTSLEKLSIDEVNKLSSKDFQNVINVKEVGVVAGETTKMLEKLNIKFVVYSNGNPPQVENINFIPSNKIHIINKFGVSYVSLPELEKVIKNAGILERVVTEYKKKRVDNAK